MKLVYKQRGASMWEACLYISVFLFVVTIALKLGPLYIDDMNIATGIKSTHQALAGKDIHEVTNYDIKNVLSKNFQVSLISDERLKDVQIERTGGKLLLKLKYDVTNDFMGNVGLTVHFDHEVNLAEPFKE